MNSFFQYTTKDICGFKRTETLNEVTNIKYIAITNVYNREPKDKLIRKHSQKSNTKCKLVNPNNRNNKLIALEYMNIMLLIIRDKLKKIICSGSL